MASDRDAGSILKAGWAWLRKAWRVLWALAKAGWARLRKTWGAWGALLALAIVAAGSLALSFAVRSPSRRQYPQRQEVRFWHMWTANWKDKVDGIVERFNQSQDAYELVALSVPGQAANSKFLLAVAGGDPPDCMAQWNPVIPKWADSKLLTPLNSLMTPEEWAAFQTRAYPVARKIGIYKGDLYGVTTGLNIWACYYRIDHLQQQGLDPNAFPDTLEELVEWGRKLHRFDAGGDLTRLGFLPQSFPMYAPGFGGGFWNWQRPGDGLLLDTPENLRCLRYLVDRRKELGFENVLRFESGLQTGFSTEWPFISGQYSITMDGQWKVEQLARYAPEVRYGTAPIPPPAGGPKHFGWSNGNFMVIPRGARCTKGAWEFIKFWSGLEKPRRAAEFYTWGGWLPLSKDIAEAPKYREYVRKHPQFQTFLDVLPSENIHPTPPVPFQDYLWDRLRQADESAMRGTLTPTQALGRLAEEVEVERRKRREFGYED